MFSKFDSKLSPTKDYIVKDDVVYYPIFNTSMIRLGKINNEEWNFLDAMSMFNLGYGLNQNFVDNNFSFTLHDISKNWIDNTYMAFQIPYFQGNNNDAIGVIYTLPFLAPADGSTKDIQVYYDNGNANATITRNGLTLTITSDVINSELSTKGAHVDLHYNFFN